MKKNRSALSVLPALTCSAMAAWVPRQTYGEATSSWVYYDDKGKLQYAADSAGNRIMDFSWAGYRGGGVALPSVAKRVTVAPSGKDDTAASRDHEQCHGWLAV